MNSQPRSKPSDAVLYLRGFGAGFGDRVILADIHLVVPAFGLMALMGPTGSGKSTLLRILGGVAQQNANLKTWGEASYRGALLGANGWPGLVSQHARMLLATVLENLVSAIRDRSELSFAQQREKVCAHLQDLGCAHLTAHLATPAVDIDSVDQRLVSIIRQTLTSPDLLCVDEPTAGLAEQDQLAVLSVLKIWARKHAVLMSSHHQQSVREHSDTVALLASGRIQEAATAKIFFLRPASVSAREFVERGTCTSTRPDARPEELADDAPPPPPLTDRARRAMSAWVGPRGFVWLEAGRLAGTPQPGIVEELAHDLDALARVGVTRLLTLLEQPLQCDEELRKRGIEAHFERVADMTAPSIEQGEAICTRIDQWLDSGQTVAVHCRAGHGRTGTALAAYRIWKGASALEAVEAVRRLEPRWIQSRAQIDFLVGFARHRRSK